MDRRALLTCLGLNPRSACYRMKEKSIETPLAPVALLAWYKDHNRLPEKLVAFCTPNAQETFSKLEEELEVRGIHIECVPELIDPPDIAFTALVEKMGRGIQENLKGEEHEVVVDFTHGFRDWQLALLMAVQQLEAMGKLTVSEAYYARLKSTSWGQSKGSPQQREKGEGDFTDLFPAFSVWKWVEAYRFFRDTGLSHFLAERMRDMDEDLSRLFEQLGWCYQAGLVVGLARTVREILDRRGRLKEKLKGMPLGEEVADLICNELESYSLDNPEELSRAHIEMHLNMVKRLWEAGSYPVALTLLYELVLSWVILECATKGRESWADGRARGGVKKRIIEICTQYGKSKSGSSAIEIDEKKVRQLLGREDQVADKLKELGDARNIVAHHGLRFSSKMPEEWKRLYDFWARQKIGQWLGA